METTNTKQPTYKEKLIELEKDLRVNGDRVIRIATDDFPLETIKGKPITNFIRKLLLTKHKITYKEWRRKGGCQINFN